MLKGRPKVSCLLGDGVKGCAAGSEGLLVCWVSQPREAGCFLPNWQDLK